MTDPQPRKPLFDGRGFVLVDDFCRAKGLVPSDLPALLDAGLAEGAFDEAGRLVGLWDDALPSPEQLRHLGAVVSSRYAPEALRSTTDHRGDEDEDDDSREPAATWTITW